LANSIKSIEEEYLCVYDLAVRLLARRAHGEQELTQKLKSRQYSSKSIERALARCHELNYLDDAGFAEDRIRSRLNNSGWGPARVRSELYSLGIHPDLIISGMECVLAEVDLVELAGAVRVKRFGPAGQLIDVKERKRQWDFLFRRGFDSETIGCVLV
jgi:regulatory protein